MKRNIFILFICLLFSGCGLVISDLNLFRSGNAPIKVSQEQKKRYEKAKELIGKSKQDVIKEFGSNLRLSRRTILALSQYTPGNDNVGDLLRENLIKLSGINSYFRVDEVDYYRYDDGIPIIMPDQYGVFFYFIDNICVYVSGSG